MREDLERHIALCERRTRELGGSESRTCQEKSRIVSFVTFLVMVGRRTPVNLVWNL